MPEEKRRIEKPAEPQEEEKKCYNCGRTGHFIKDCRKPKTKDAEYYRNKLRLTKKKESGRAMLVEEDQFLTDTDDSDDDGSDQAHFCLMAQDKGSSDDEGDNEADGDDEFEETQTNDAGVLGKVNIEYAQTLVEHIERQNRKITKLEFKIRNQSTSNLDDL